MLWLTILRRNMTLKRHRNMRTKKNFVKLWQIHEISANFSCFMFISPKFAQILQYFAQSCDCMIAAFRNSVHYTELLRPALNCNGNSIPAPSCTAFCALDCTAPICNELQGSVIHWILLHWLALHFNELDCTSLNYTALHCTAPQCTAQHCTALHCTARQW